MPVSNEKEFYALGHSERELNRLSRQAHAFESFTRNLCLAAGIHRGMRILDVGCGSGDVSFLLSSIVGPEGLVIGIDRETFAVERARARAQSLSLSNVSFLSGEADALDFVELFDAVVGRLVLMYQRNPTMTLQRVSRLVRHGGLIVFQEFDEENCRSIPTVPLFEQCTCWIKETLVRSGAQHQMGPKLFRAFVEAGLPAPAMRMEALIGGGPHESAYGLVAEVIISMLPAMQKLGIVTADDVGPQTLEQRLREAVIAQGGVVISPGLIGAWTHKL